MDPAKAVKLVPDLLASGRFSEARPLVEDLIAESIVEGWPAGLLELERVSLQVAESASSPEIRVPYAALAAVCALLDEREPQNLVGLAFVYGTKAHALTRALELLRLAARRGDPQAKDDSAWAMVVLYKMVKRQGGDLSAYMVSGEPLHHREADADLDEEVRAFSSRMASLRVSARRRGDSLERAALELAGDEEQALLYLELDRALLDGVATISADPSLSADEGTLLNAMLDND